MTDFDVAVPAIVGLHHVRLPVSNVMRSRDWYIEVFGFEPRLTFEEETHVVGVVVGHRNGLTLGLHDAPRLARELRGFCPLAFTVGSHDELLRWCAHLDGLGVPHSTPTDAHIGFYVEVHDPDGIVIELHTTGEPAVDEA